MDDLFTRCQTSGKVPTSQTTPDLPGTLERQDHKQRDPDPCITSEHRNNNPPASPTLGWAYCTHASYSPTENYSVWELAEGKRPRGGQKRRFKDQLKRSLAQASIPDNNWETIARERHSWKVTVREGVEAFEAQRRSQVDLKRQEHKRRQAATPPPATLPCDYCPRLFRHRLGLLSHLRAHKRHQKDS